MITPYMSSFPRMENLIEREQKKGLEIEAGRGPKWTPKSRTLHRGVIVVSVKSTGGNEVVSGMLK